MNTWESEYNPGSSVYLLENGNLLRTARIPGSLQGGGVGGRIELFDWDNNLLWAYEYASDLVHQHHDIGTAAKWQFFNGCMGIKKQKQKLSQPEETPTQFPFRGFGLII